MTEEMMLVPKRVLKMVSVDGFISCYYSMMKNRNTREEAYESCEDLHEKYFGRRKYSGFDSFKKILYRKINRK
ncbi:hypothetical protein DN752_19590 [Echinicola strongylocentroti]|uniref:Uncharacterized protein n=1 Tax=Echinicola strongylocentroti TaxID=1795355 RepID=A0A2Z4IMN6_9BACT|nr:hypothetical protein DN752_19590 [Echinicola strongylocentroti]